MAITTNAQLKTAIASWLARSDLTDNLQDFVTLFEAWANRNLRVRQMETLSTITTTDGSTNLPDDYLAWRKLIWNASTEAAMEYVAPEMFHRFYPSSDDGTPRFFTIEGSTLKTRPVDDSTGFVLNYYAKLDGLSADSDTNWLLDEHPDLYLAGSLVEANAFLLNPDHASLWAGKRDTIAEEIRRLSNVTKGPAQIRSMGPVF